MENYYPGNCHEQLASPLAELVPWPGGSADMGFGQLDAGAELPELEDLALEGQQNDDYPEQETATPRSPYQRLTGKEEMLLGTRLRESFARACDLIRRQTTVEKRMAALQSEIAVWCSGQPSPVPQKRRINRIRQALKHVDKGDGCYSQAWKGEVLALLAEVDQTAEELIHGNMALVHVIALKFLGKGVGLSDLTQEGNIGLIKAAYRFDCIRARFATYATFWIRQAMGKAIVDQPRTIRLPAHLCEQRNRFFKCYHQMRRELGHSPADEDVASRAEVPMRMVKRFRATPPAVSLNAPISEGVDLCLGDVVADEQQVDADEIMNRKKIGSIIEKTLTELKPKEEEVLRLRYGISETRPHTLEEIGEKFGLSRERVRQIEKAALQRLRHPVRHHRLHCLL